MAVFESEQKAHPQVTDEGEHALPLRDVLRIIWSRLWIIVLVIVVTMGIAAGFSFVQRPVYESSTELLVGQKQEAGDASTNLGSNVEGLQRLTKTLTEAASSRPVAEAVIEQQGLETTPESLLEDLKVQQIPETQFIKVDYRDSNPERAQLVVDTVGKVFSERISAISPDTNAVTVTVWEPATVPESPVSPNPTLNILLGLVLGTALGTALVFLLEYLDNGRRSVGAWRRNTTTELDAIPSLSAPKEALDKVIERVRAR